MSNDLNEKAEEAIAKVIRDADTGLPDGQVFTSFSDQTEVLGPHSVTIQCLGGPEDGFGSGNYRMSFSVQVRSNADFQPADAPGTPRSLHRQYTGKVFDALKQTNLAALLSAAVTDFTVFDSIKRSHGPSRLQERKFVSELGLEFSCNAADIS